MPSSNPHKETTIRAFIAIDMGDEVREALDGLQRKLKKCRANVRWVKPRNIHLTLAFLGDVPAQKLESLKTALDENIKGLEPFELEVAGLGTFGRPSHPRVIWAGMPDSPSLMELRQKTSVALQSVEIDFDTKPFSPHLTLGRVRAIDHHIESLLAKVETYKDALLGQVRIDAVQLIQSQLSTHSAEYTVLHRAPLS